MKKNTHPEHYNITATCTCGAHYETQSTSPSIKVTLCAQCHPFYTGEQKHVDTAGRIDRFKKKFEAYSSAKGK